MKSRPKEGLSPNAVNLRERAVDFINSLPFSNILIIILYFSNDKFCVRSVRKRYESFSFRNRNDFVYRLS